MNNVNGAWRCLRNDSEHHHQHVKQMHGCEISSRLTEKCKMWTRDTLEDLAAQMTKEVLRLCYMPSRDLWESLYGNALVRLASVTSVLIALCSVGSENPRKTARAKGKWDGVSTPEFWLSRVGWFKDTVHVTEQAPLQNLRHEIETACNISPATMQEVCHTVAHLSTMH